MNISDLNAGSTLTLRYATYAELVDSNDVIRHSELRGVETEPRTGGLSPDSATSQDSATAEKLRLHDVLLQLGLHPVNFTGVDTIADLARKHGVTTPCMPSRLARLCKKLKLKKMPASQMLLHVKKCLA